MYRQTGLTLRLRKILLHLRDHLSSNILFIFKSIIEGNIDFFSLITCWSNFSFFTANQIIYGVFSIRHQAFWRGYRVRREVSSLKVKKARKRIESANAAATESMKLCNRTRSALDFLLQCKNISRIVGALVNLGKFETTGETKKYC